MAPIAQTHLNPALLDAAPDQIVFGNFGAHFVAHPGLTWKIQVVSVAFYGGNDRIYALIEAAASEWTAHGGALSWSFRDAQGHFRQWSPSDRRYAANIRVAFASGEFGGYWSAIGVVASDVPPNQATLNLENFDEELTPYVDGANATAWRQSYAHSVVLHEFGHALGLSHENFHPDCLADLNVDAAIAWLSGSPNNWPPDRAAYNVDPHVYFSALMRQSVDIHADAAALNSPHVDQASVMLYDLRAAPGAYKSGIHSPCRPSSPSGYATALSPGDRAFFMANYGHI